jgi:hypothetical protein
VPALWAVARSRGRQGDHEPGVVEVTKAVAAHKRWAAESLAAGSHGVQQPHGYVHARRVWAQEDVDLALRLRLSDWRCRRAGCRSACMRGIVRRTRGWPPAIRDRVTRCWWRMRSGAVTAVGGLTPRLGGAARCARAATRRPRRGAWRRAPGRGAQAGRGSGRGAGAVTAAIPPGPIHHAATTQRRADRSRRGIRAGAG